MIQKKFKSRSKQFIDTHRNSDPHLHKRMYTRIADGGVTEIAAAFSGAAIGEARCDILEVGLAGEDIVAKGSELRGGGVPGGVADNTALRVLPGGLASGALVFDEYVRRHHFFRRHR